MVRGGGLIAASNASRPGQAPGRHRRGAIRSRGSKVVESFTVRYTSRARAGTGTGNAWATEASWIPLRVVRRLPRHLRKVAPRRYSTFRCTREPSTCPCRGIKATHHAPLSFIELASSRRWLIVMASTPRTRAARGRGREDVAFGPLIIGELDTTRGPNASTTRFALTSLPAPLNLVGGELVEDSFSRFVIERRACGATTEALSPPGRRSILLGT